MIQAQKLGQAGRSGIVEQVLGRYPQRLLVRWGDGHTSVIAPSDGVALVEPARKAPAKAGRAARTRR